MDTELAKCRLTRRWFDGFSFAKSNLLAIDTEIKRLLGPDTSACFSVATSRSYERTYTSLEAALEEPNSHIRPIEKIVMLYLSGTVACNAPTESCSITISIISSEPAILLEVTSSENARVALVNQELENKLAVCLRPKGKLAKFFIPQRTGEMAPFDYLVLLLPIGTALYVVKSIRHELVALASAFRKTVSPSGTAADLTRMLLDYLVQQDGLRAKQLSIVMTALGLSVLLGMVGLAIKPQHGISIDRLLLFGEQAGTQERRKRFVNNVLWTGCVGFAVSALASLFIYMLTK